MTEPNAKQSVTFDPPTIPSKVISLNIAFALLLTAIVVYFSLNSRVFLDDSYIYLRVARNMVAGWGPVLNPGDSHFAVTSPLWVHLLALGLKLGLTENLVLLSKILTILLLTSASWPAFLLLRPHVGTWAVLTPIPIFFNFITLTTIGGEIALVYFSLFGLLYFHLQSRNYWLAGLFSAIAYLARAELILLLPILLLYDIMKNWKAGTPWRPLIGNWLKLALCASPGIIIWHSYYYHQFHTLFPNTLHTKIVQGRSGQWPLYYNNARPQILTMLHGYKWLSIPMLLGIYFLRPLSLVLVAFTTLHYYAYSWLVIPFYHWYYYDFFIIIPLFIAFGIVASFNWLMLRFKLSHTLRLGLSSLTLGIVLSLFVTTTSVVKMKDLKNDSRFSRYSEIAKVLLAVAQPRDALLTVEIGIISYLLPDMVIHDINGIATPQVNLENINQMEHFVRLFKPRFLFFPSFIPQHKLEQVYPDKNGQNLVYRRLYPTTVPSDGWVDTVYEKID